MLTLLTCLFGLQTAVLTLLTCLFGLQTAVLTLLTCLFGLTEKEGRPFEEFPVQWTEKETEKDVTTEEPQVSTVNVSHLRQFCYSLGGQWNVSLVNSSRPWKRQLLTCNVCSTEQC